MPARSALKFAARGRNAGCCPPIRAENIKLGWQLAYGSGKHRCERLRRPGKYGAVHCCLCHAIHAATIGSGVPFLINNGRLFARYTIVSLSLYTNVRALRLCHIVFSSCPRGHLYERRSCNLGPFGRNTRPLLYAPHVEAGRASRARNIPPGQPTAVNSSRYMYVELRFDVGILLLWRRQGTCLLQQGPQSPANWHGCPETTWARKAANPFPHTLGGREGGERCLLLHAAFS